MKIISIANQKGGCGKTTTAINLASALSLNGKRVLLLDLDPQAHASLGLDIESRDSIYNVISNLTPRKLKIENIIKRVENKFDILPSNILVGTLEQELSDEIGRELKLSEVLNPLRADYDYVLIDCPPSLGILTVNALRVSDELVIPVETSRFSLQGVEHLQSIVDLVKNRLNHCVKVQILITMFDSRLRHSFAMLSTFREKFSDQLLDTIIHVNVKLKESAVNGKTVSEFDKYCRGSKDYNTLAMELISQERAEEEAQEAQEVQGAKGSSKEVHAEEVVQTQAEQEQIVQKSEEDPSPVFSEKMKTMVAQEMDGMFKTKFVIEAPKAKSVYVTGSFNHWSLDENCKLRNLGDHWEVDIPLRAGTYEYQFIVDGIWTEDSSNPRSQKNIYGDCNSVLEVGAA